MTVFQGSLSLEWNGPPERHLHWLMSLPGWKQHRQPAFPWKQLTFHSECLQTCFCWHFWVSDSHCGHYGKWRTKGSVLWLWLRHVPVINQPDRTCWEPQGCHTSHMCSPLQGGIWLATASPIACVHPITVIRSMGGLGLCPWLISTCHWVVPVTREQMYPQSFKTLLFFTTSYTI